MKIHIVTGRGFGETKLSAFDAALKDAGIHNYNLVYLSSIIPKDSKVVYSRRYKASAKEYGYRLYVVRAETRSEKPGEVITAGLGWYQLDDKGGVFVEHTSGTTGTVSAARKEIEHKIERSIQDLCRYRRFKYEPERLKMAIRSAKIADRPACVLAVAVYQAEGW